MKNIFPTPIINLPEAELPFKGATAYLSQGNNHQILFMKFDEDIELPAHSHNAQWGIVLEGQIELTIGGIKNLFKKGNRYFIPKETIHSGKIFAGYADITYFDQPDRYKIKTKD
ncbi:MAG: cupin domain-containing protein [Bacteroidota bacterium]